MPAKSKRNGAKHGKDQLTIMTRNAWSNKSPVIVPIGEAKYAFTIGMPKLSADCKGELVISLLPPQTAAGILKVISDKIISGTIKPATEWKDGTIIPSSNIGVSVSVDLRVKILGLAQVEKYLGLSRRIDLEIPPSDIAYQLIWPDESGEFEDEVVRKQSLE